MTAPRITAEEIACLEDDIKYAEEAGETVDSEVACKLIDALIIERSELDRLSAQGGEVPEISYEAFAEIMDTTELIGGVRDREKARRERITKWFRANSRPAPPHPDAVEASKEALDHHFALGFVEACGILAEKPFDQPTMAKNIIQEGGYEQELLDTPSDYSGIQKLRDEMKDVLDTLRAQAQPATEREGA